MDTCPVDPTQLWPALTEHLAGAELRGLGRGAVCLCLCVCVSVLCLCRIHSGSTGQARGAGNRGPHRQAQEHIEENWPCSPAAPYPAPGPRRPHWPGLTCPPPSARTFWESSCAEGSLPYLRPFVWGAVPVCEGPAGQSGVFCSLSLWCFSHAGPVFLPPRLQSPVLQPQGFWEESLWPQEGSHLGQRSVQLTLRTEATRGPDGVAFPRAGVWVSVPRRVRVAVACCGV